VLKSARIQATSALSLLVFCATIVPATAQLPAPSPANDLDGPGIVFAFGWPQTRSLLPAAQLEAGEIEAAPVDVSGFLPAGALAGIGDPLRGRMILPDTAVSIRALGSKVDGGIVLPATKLDLISHGDRLLPVQDLEDTVIRPDRRFTLHFGVGRIWRETTDGDRSRALLPVTLIDSRYRAAHNGLALFLYGGDAPPSPVLFQFTQESAPERAADIWATARAVFRDREPNNAGIRIAAFETRQATAPVFKEWSDLPGYPAPALDGFDGAPEIAGSVSASGLVVEETAYLKGCPTRTGPYPFCRQMRHALGAASGTLLAFAAVAHLTQRFGSEVLTDRIAKRLPELAGHPTWTRATPRDVLNMAVGIDHWRAVPDPSERAALVAETREAILAAAAMAPSGDDLPGVRFVYRPGDLMTLSVALDAHAKARFGPNGSLRAALDEGFFKPMGLRRVQMQVTAGAAPWDRVPDLANGFYPTTGELVRIIAALQRTADRTRKSGFDGALSREALRPTEALGFDTGMAAEAGPLRWHLGFWRRPVQPSPNCRRFVASAIGRGGTVISLMPNGVAAFRISDGTPAAPGTRDSSALRAAGHAVRPFCG
jgi:hypothetical protein